MTTQIEVRRPINRTLAVIDGGLSAAAAVQPIATALKPKLLDQVRQAIRTRHYSYMTEKAYVSWIKRFIFFHDKRHPADMGEPEIAGFLSSLATDSKVSASPKTRRYMRFCFCTKKFCRARSVSLTASSGRKDQNGCRLS